MELRPYQIAACEAIHRQWRSGIRKTLLILPTGTGKTIVFARVIADLVGRGERVLILAHRGELLEQADSVVYVSREYHKSCMLERNRFLVDHAQILLAVYNGEYRGGTAATVRYARKMGRTLIVIDPLTCQITREAECSRAP